MADGERNGAVVAEPPRSIDQASLDEKGRLKLPAAFTGYLQAIGEKTLFITSFDFQQVLLYPLSTWKANEAVLESAGDDAQAAARLAYIAKTYGSDAEVDLQGRVLVPAVLRERMKLEKQAMVVNFHNGRIGAVSKAVHDARLAEFEASLTQDLATMSKRGLK